MRGITIKRHIGIGDGLQFSSLPENYFKATGEKLIDISKPWFFDYNPYVERDPFYRCGVAQELWNFGPKQYEWPRPRNVNAQVYQSNAEIWAALFGVPVVLNRPRLYRFEEAFPFSERNKILLQTHGRSHGVLPQYIIDHVINKYGQTGQLYHIGLPKDPDYGIPKIPTPTFWDLAKVISECRMIICPDSGPSWVAACYPDVVVKKIRTRPDLTVLKSQIPLRIDDIHSHWDDRCHQIFNISQEDVGFTSAYTKI